MIDSLVRLLAGNPLLLLFLVAAIGFPLGRLRVRGSELGVAAVLFVGLAAGALDPSLALPEIVYMLGLAIFVYTVGLSSGGAFVASLRRDGLRQAGVAVAAVAFATLASAVAARALGLSRAHAAGLFSGAVTNTPALAAAIETLKQAAPERAVSDPVVAYSICYPMGVVGVVLAIRLARALWQVDPAAETARLVELGATSDPIDVATVEVRQELGGLTIEELVRGLRCRVVFGRLRRGAETALAGPDVRLVPGDRVTVVGAAAEIERVAKRIGATTGERLDADRSEFDLRRLFVSNPEVAGRPLRELNVFGRVGALVTRVRRGDVDLLPHEEMRLEIGDRVRVLAPVNRAGAVTAFFGDSYRAASEVDILTFALGLALGLVLGILPIPLPGGVRVTLGFAGGPLIVALLLGTVERTGTLIWNMPFSAGVALRQIGLILFLAGIGTRAGSGFLATFATASGLRLFVAGAAITFLTALLAMFLARRVLKLPMPVAMGLVAGVHTQPAVLGWALEQTKDDVPNLGYASAYPAATIAKLLLVQLIVVAGGHSLR